MFGGESHKVKLDGELLRKVRLAAQKSSSSVDEFVCNLLERETEKLLAADRSQKLSSEQVADIENSLKGLGYLE